MYILIISIFFLKNCSCGHGKVQVKTTALSGEKVDIIQNYTWVARCAWCFQDFIYIKIRFVLKRSHTLIIIFKYIKSLKKSLTFIWGFHHLKNHFILSDFKLLLGGTLFPFLSFTWSKKLAKFNLVSFIQICSETLEIKDGEGKNCNQENR